MDKSTWGVLVTCFALGFALYHFNVAEIQTRISETLNYIQTAVEPTVNSIKTNPVPVLIGAVPAIIAIGTLATKAYSSLQKRSEQTITTLNTQKIQAETQLTETATQATNLQSELQTTKDKLKLYEDIYEANRQMTAKVNAIPAEITNIETRFQGDVSTLAGKIRDLERKIEESKKVT